MKNPPELGMITAKLMEIATEKLHTKVPLVPNQPLISVLGLDSLDMIELGFCIEEVFELEFSGKNVFEELDLALGESRILKGGVLTELGREMLLVRAPELRHLELPAELTAQELQKFYTLETFSRLIREFYLATPDQDPGSGERIVLQGFSLVREASGQSFRPPSGDQLLDAWVREQAAMLQEDPPLSEISLSDF